jgi:SagB-type dehydrogenase family enzyme
VSNGSDLEAVMRYHERTKHHLHRYARGPGRLDWANQPDPFRRYRGARLTRLPVLDPGEEPRSPPYESLYAAGAVPSVPLDVRAVSRLLEYALALSAWKQAGGTRWALRVNPSSGNLHPTEGYLLLGAMAGLADAPALYHYAPKEHALERRAECPPELFTRLLHGFPPQAFLLALSSVYWREAWKYGERAFRYCQHDAGHAIAAVRMAAATLGWSALVLDATADETIETLLGLDRGPDFDGAEREHAELAMAIWPSDGARTGCAVALGLEPDAVRELARGSWYGKANRLSADDPVRWELIDEVAAASRKTRSEPRLVHVLEPFREPSGGASGATPAGQIIRQRRSLLACDGRTSLEAGRFYRMLERVMPVPWDAMPWQPAIHFGLFVHRVEGIEPGLYALARDRAKLQKLRASMREEFLWEPPPGCPPELALFLLERGDARSLATQLSCHQDIAGEGAFSLGMFAEYHERLAEQGAAFYRRIFREAGAIGQVLYLEAEAAGVRATGIGCFFDDPVHRVFGLRDLAFQSLYHFTVGGAVNDPRLTTLPPYR